MRIQVMYYLLVMGAGKLHDFSRVAVDFNKGTYKAY